MVSVATSTASAAPASSVAAASTTPRMRLTVCHCAIVGVWIVWVLGELKARRGVAEL